MVAQILAALLPYIAKIIENALDSDNYDPEVEAQQLMAMQRELHDLRVRRGLT